MTRAEKVAKAQELRRSGLKLREIAERMGVGKSTVSNWLSDPDGSRLRARKATYGGVCEDCGGPTSGTRNGLDRVPRWCRDCFQIHAQATLRENSAARHSARDRQIEAWWNEGLSMNEIADRLDWSTGHLGNEIHRLREHGYDLAYRQRPSNPATDRRFRVAA